MKVNIGGSEYERVAIDVRGHSQTEVGCELNADVSIQVGAWSGDYTAWLLLDDFVRFGNELEALQTQRSGNAVFNTMERQLGFSFTLDNLGRIKVAGQARERAGDGNLLEFTFHLDQTHLPQIGNMINDLISHCST